MRCLNAVSCGLFGLLGIYETTLGDHNIVSKKVFISHAVADKPIVDAFVDLLQTGANVSSDEIFCSSLEGLGIPTGVNFIDQIKGEIQNPELVVALISPNYLVSQFCMCELGASWAMSHRMLPLLVPPLEYADVQGVLKSTQITRLNDETGMSQFATEVGESLPGIKINIPRWNAKQKAFQKQLPKLLKKAGVPNDVSPAEFESAISELEETKAALDEISQENSQLEEKVSKLKECKNAEEVKAVESEFSSSQEQLDMLFKQASDRLKIFNQAVSFVAYREYSSYSETHFDYHKDPDTLDYAQEAVDNELLIDSEPGYSLNKGHPKIKKLVKALDALAMYINSEAPAELDQQFEEEHEIPLSIANKELWEFALDSRLGRVYA